MNMECFYPNFARGLPPSQDGKPAGHEMRFRSKKDVVTRRIAGETLLVPIRANLADMNRLFVLEGVGEFIWEQLDGEKSLDEICDEMVRRFEVEKEEARTDLNDFVGRLREADLISEIPPPGEEAAV